MPTRPVREMGLCISGSFIHHDGLHNAKALVSFGQRQTQVSVLGENLGESSDLVENALPA